MVPCFPRTSECVQQWLDPPSNKSTQAYQETGNPGYIICCSTCNLLLLRVLQKFWKVLLQILLRAAQWIWPAGKLSYSVGTIHTHPVKDLWKPQITHTAPQPCSQPRQGRFDISWRRSCISKFKSMLQAVVALQSAFADPAHGDISKRLSPHLLHAPALKEIGPKCLIAQLVCTDPVLLHQAPPRAEHQQLASSKADTDRSPGSHHASLRGCLLAALTWRWPSPHLIRAAAGWGPGSGPEPEQTSAENQSKGLLLWKRSLILKSALEISNRGCLRCTGWGITSRAVSAEHAYLWWQTEGAMSQVPEQGSLIIPSSYK